jgi:hypothetical protein
MLLGSNLSLVLTFSGKEEAPSPTYELTRFGIYTYFL